MPGKESSTSPLARDWSGLESLEAAVEEYERQARLEAEKAVAPQCALPRTPITLDDWWTAMGDG